MSRDEKWFVSAAVRVHIAQSAATPTHDALDVLAALPPRPLLREFRIAMPVRR